MILVKMTLRSITISSNKEGNKMKKILIITLLLVLLTGCTKKPNEELLVEVSDAIQEMYIDLDNPITTLQAYIFSEYTSENEYLLDTDNLLYSPDIYNHFMSMHREWGYFPDEVNQYLNLKEINPDNKTSFSYNDHRMKFTIDGDVVIYEISGSEVNETIKYDTVAKEILGSKLTWKDIYDWINSGELDLENQSIRYVNENMIVMITKGPETYIFIMDYSSKTLYYYQIERDFDTRICDIRIFRVGFNDFLFSLSFPVNSGNNDVWIKSKSLPNELGDWDEFLNNEDNIIKRVNENGPYIYLRDTGNHFDEVMNLFTTYFGDDSSNTMWSQSEEIGPRFDLTVSEVTINQTEVESYDFHALIDPVESPEYFYPEEFIITITHNLTNSTLPGVYTVTFKVEDSLGNATTKELSVTIQ